MVLRVLGARRPTTVYSRCSHCYQDIVYAMIPDEVMDGCKQAVNFWCVPLYDLVYLRDGMIEEEEDRLLWGNKSVMEERIAALPH